MTSLAPPCLISAFSINGMPASFSQIAFRKEIVQLLIATRIQLATELLGCKYGTRRGDRCLSLIPENVLHFPSANIERSEREIAGTDVLSLPECLSEPCAFA